MKTFLDVEYHMMLIISLHLNITDLTNVTSNICDYPLVHLTMTVLLPFYYPGNDYNSHYNLMPPNFQNCFKITQIRKLVFGGSPSAMSLLCVYITLESLACLLANTRSTASLSSSSASILISSSRASFTRSLSLLSTTKIRPAAARVRNKINHLH